MTFTFQQPGSDKLLIAINDLALNADSGGAVFAFASKGGVDALFECSNILAILTAHKPFHIVVGIDAITNAEALLRLGEKLDLFPANLTVDVFLHAHPNSTFHPKFTWFRHGKDISLVTGSGNLTLSGLGRTKAAIPPSGNWEAFTSQLLKGTDSSIAWQHIADWFRAQNIAGTLSKINDVRVLNKAMANGRVRFRTTPPIIAVAPTQDNEAAPLDRVTFETPEILVREIPKNRLGQADVGKAALTEFFGYEGAAKKILIQQVYNVNEVESAHEILLFVNQSRNYRLELSAITNLGYEVADDDSRMVLIATKLDRRSFRYMVLPVSAPDYHFVTDILGPLPTKTGGGRSMREKRISPEDMLIAWPSIPANLLPLNLAISEP